MVCPKCGAQLSDEMIFCNQCGEQVRLGRKRAWGKFILLFMLFVVIAGVGAYTYYIRNVKPVQMSAEAFDQAHLYEDQNEYRKAFDYYSMVIPEDEQNFQSAQDRIAELNVRFDANKMAAIGYMVLKQAGYVNNRLELTDIKVNVEQRKMTCRIDGIGFVISRQSLDDADYHPSIKSETDDYYITEFKAVFVENGFLTSELNSIRQDTSNTFFMIEELSTKGELVRDELMEEYIDSYQNTGELPLFSGNI